MKIVSDVGNVDYYLTSASIEISESNGTNRTKIVRAAQLLMLALAKMS